MDYTDIIAQAIALGNEPNIRFENDDDYKPFDEYVDKLIMDGYIVKHDQWDFTGDKFAELLNEKLSLLNSKYRIISESETVNDPRITASIKDNAVRVKGQAVYFMLVENETVVKQMIFTWSYEPVTLWDLE